MAMSSWLTRWHPATTPEQGQLYNLEWFNKQLNLSKMKEIKHSTAKCRHVLIFYHSLAVSDKIVENINSSQVFYDAQLSRHILISTLPTIHLFPLFQQVWLSPRCPKWLVTARCDHEKICWLWCHPTLSGAKCSQHRALLSNDWYPKSHPNNWIPLRLMWT